MFDCAVYQIVMSSLIGIGTIDVIRAEKVDGEGKSWFLVKWKGYSEKDNEWKAESSFAEGAKHPMIARFRAVKAWQWQTSANNVCQKFESLPKQFSAELERDYVAYLKGAAKGDGPSVRVKSQLTGVESVMKIDLGKLLMSNDTTTVFLRRTPIF